MARVLRNKATATRFQILVAIAQEQPFVQQKDIAVRLRITPQAVSTHIEELLKEGMIVTDGRSKYSVTRMGVNWIIVNMRELEDYLALARTAVNNIVVCAAVADVDLVEGQEVGLEMRDGLLIATCLTGQGAKGVAVAPARKGEDVGITRVEGIVELHEERITILKIPDIQRGGSARVDYRKLKSETKKAKLIGSMGIEGIIALKRIGVVPDYVYGVHEAAIEAARSGLRFLAICSNDSILNLLRRVMEEGLDYEIIDISRDK